MMKLLSAIGLSALLLAGCDTSNSEEYTTYALNQHYAGRPVNMFFSDYGVPEAEFEENGKGRIYRWSSVQPARMPAHANLHAYEYSNGKYVVGDTYQGRLERQYCELRIYTDTEDNVRRFSLAVDSLGKWSVSRCSELFQL